MAGSARGPRAQSARWRRLRGLVDRPSMAFRRAHARRSEAEVFPWLEHSAAAFGLIGAAVAVGLDLAYGFGTGWVALGAIAGASAGAWLALHWASPASPLWDRWLDGSRGIQAGPTAEEDAPDLDLDAEPEPRRALVRPRVASDEGESLPLEDVLGPILTGHERGAVRITGPDGSGKSTALEYLAGVLPPHLGASVMDNPDPLALPEASGRGLVVVASSHHTPNPIAELTLSPWGRDEWIEYLLSADRDRCASVMARLGQCEADAELLGGNPELWSIVLDLMAADESVDGPRPALRIEFDRRLADPGAGRLIEGDCLAALALRGKSHPRRVALLRRHGPDEALFRLIRHRAVQLLLAADRLADDLARGDGARVLADPIPLDLVRETASRVAGRPKARESLRELVGGPVEEAHPMAASLLHALDEGWRPPRSVLRLNGAYLREAEWRDVALEGADLRAADLARADLRGARLTLARFNFARLASADLRAASLASANLRGADLHLARLAQTDAGGADFSTARLTSADLEGANLNRALLEGADLRDARFSGTNLVGVALARAQIEGADFGGANLKGADLGGLRLAGARFEGARFPAAILAQCDLEGMALPGADFAGANLYQALLTGSRMPRATFRGANLRLAGLAEVEWEGADLRGADLTGAAFHLGSSRSGLVGSPIASEGSRTGFYTDDYDDQGFKSPEEIRKADLRRVDLRGAKIEGADFYLVDLRGATLDPDQRDHLRRCGAILESRA